MEVSGIEGSYRSTCEKTMGVLRDNKGSLVDMLEAFVHDPLISWRVSFIKFIQLGYFQYAFLIYFAAFKSIVRGVVGRCRGATPFSEAGTAFQE